jgi:hypothetical protein
MGSTRRDARVNDNPQSERWDGARAGTAPIPLRDAVLCIDCDTVYGGLSVPCPSCGGKSRLCLQTILHSMACGA